MALFKIFKGQAANLPTSYNDGYCYVTIDDGKMYIDTTNDAKGRIVLNAAHADTASSAEKLTTNAGSSSKPVYFSGGIPVACSILELDTTGTAAWSKGERYTINFTTLTPKDCYDLAVNSDNYEIIYGYMEMESGTMATAPDGYLLVPCETHIHKWTNTMFIYQTIKYYNHNIGSSDSVSIDGYTEYWRTNASTTQWTNWQIGTAPMVQAGNANTPIYINGNGIPTACTSLDLNATTATTANKLATDAGDADTPVYFSGGIPTPCTSLDLDTTGSAAKWTNPRNFIISDGTNKGDATPVDGSEAVTLKLPTTIKATLNGNASTATNAAAADKLNNDAGSETLPVYFSGGVPVETSNSLAVNITKNAATATKLATARSFAITDATGANTGTGFSFDGSGGGTFKLPEIIKANITGNISGNAASADKINTDAGDSNTPVFFSGGIPTPCAGLDLDTTGNAATATQWATARTISLTDADETNEGTGVTIDGTGDVTLKLPETIKASLIGNAASADKLTINNGSATVPVYFSGGIPTACTSLSLNTTGSAAKLTTACNLTIMDYSLTYEGGKQPFDGSTDVILEMPSEFEGTLHGNAATATALTTSAGDSNTPVYFSNGKPVACTSLDLNTSGSSASCTGNAATATKLATARTISLTGDVTGSGSFDGSGNLTITATVADNSHNHNYAGSSSAGGAANSANWLNINSALTYGASGLNYFNISGTASGAADANGTPTADWYHIIRMNHANTNGYYTDIASCFHNDNMFYKRVASGVTNGWRRIWVEGNAVTGAVWNDYAECRESDCQEAGYVLSENGDDTLSKSNERLAPFAGVSSDTWGFSQGETEKAKTHIAVAGRVLVYPYQDRNNYKPGDCVCAAPGGTVDIMTREEVREWPDRIVGTVSCVPEYEEWGGGEGADRDPVKVNGRIWIKVK